MLSEENLRTSLNVSPTGFVGFAHGQLKQAAQIAAAVYGCDWAQKDPVTLESIELKRKLRNMVITSTPSGHSNKDVVWQRFRQYALKYSANQNSAS